jgi:hypothetical protein
MGVSGSSSETTTQARNSWAAKVRDCHRIIAKEKKGSVARVFLALQSHCDLNGYCWPLSSTLMRETALSRNAVFAALNRLEALGILHRSQLVSRGGQGRNSPALFRIGGPIKDLPENARSRYILPRAPASKSTRKVQANQDRGTKKRYVAPEVSKTSTTGVPENTIGEVSKTTTGGVPETGTQNYFTEQPPGPATVEPNEPPDPACTVDSRQDHTADSNCDENRRVGGKSPSFHSPDPRPPQNADAQHEGSQPRSSELTPPKIPPVVAYLAKHGKLPPYIPDETHLLLDDEGNYSGYVDRDGKRRDKWNNFESIEMAQHRRMNEQLHRFLASRSEKRVVVNHGPKPEAQIGPTFTWDQTVAVLRNGTRSEDEAKRWSEGTGIPAQVFLVEDQFERRAAFDEWKARRETAP